MKTLAILLVALLAGDFGLCSGANTRHAWSVTREQLKSIQHYIDQKTELPG